MYNLSYGVVEAEWVNNEDLASISNYWFYTDVGLS